MKKIQEINAAKPETWTVLNKLQQKFRISITPEHDKDGSQVKQFFFAKHVHNQLRLFCTLLRQAFEKWQKAVA